MNKTKVKCPRCHSDQPYKFGLDKEANQKYQFKKCKRQFASYSVSTPKESKFHKCVKLPSYTMFINTITIINVEIKSVIMHHHNLNINNASSEK